VDLVRRNKITRELAMKRSGTPEELRRLMGQPGDMGAGNGMTMGVPGNGAGAMR
jgi:hypothetical protein